MYKHGEGKEQERFYGNARGEVIDVNDPLGAGRIKIRFFGFYDDVSDDALPWAIFADPMMGGHSEVGGFFVPILGSHVWGFFEGGNVTQPVYFAGAPARPDGPSERSNGSYPHNKVYKTQTGHLIEIDDSPDNTRIKVTHQSGSHKTHEHDGSVLEEVKKNLSIYVEENATLYVKGNVTETVEGNVVRQVKGSVTETIEGNFETSVLGNRKEMTGGSAEHASAGVMDISGSRVNINE